MEQIPSWEANWLLASQEIPCILWNPKVQYRSQVNQHFNLQAINRIFQATQPLCHADNMSQDHPVVNTMVDFFFHCLNLTLLSLHQVIQHAVVEGLMHSEFERM